MTSSSFESLPFTHAAVEYWASTNDQHTNWPVVYILDGPKRKRSAQAVYVGESINAAKRLKQHLKTESKSSLTTARVVIDDSYNKSVCHDLESLLIQLFAGDGRYSVLNRNDGIVNADYYNRKWYREAFAAIFEELHREGLFSQSVEAIENSNLFKLSPFKALTPDQAIAVEDILDGLFTDVEADKKSTTVIQGLPGTGKTIVAIYLIKLLRDIAVRRESDESNADSTYADFFQEGNAELVADLDIGLVVPQQSLRTSIRSVFKRTPGLDARMVLSPFEVGKSDRVFDLLIVDEAHRLTQYANQSSGPLNNQFKTITENLFGFLDKERTQLDWIEKKSRHQIFLVDGAQSVRPADVRQEDLDRLLTTARSADRFYRLTSQMRVQSECDYVGFIREVFNPHRSQVAGIRQFGDYDFRLFDDAAEMRREIFRMEDRWGLSRLLAGYAWPWLSRKDSTQPDIVLDGLELFWNRTDRDWVNSPTSLDEVGSIHTIQGYDLNYAGVIIGPDLVYDPVEKRLKAVPGAYFDKKGKENVPRLGASYAADNLLRYITNAYTVLLTRGIRGTFVYACDPNLREYIRSHLDHSA